MAFCPPEPDRANKVPWIQQDSNGGDYYLTVDASGALCVKIVDGVAEPASCQTNFILGTLGAANTEVALDSLLGGLSNIKSIEIFNTKDSAKFEDLRIATTSGLVATGTEPYLNLQWGFSYCLDCGTTDNLYLASSLENHAFLIEVISFV